jgi:hypothetical protein
MNKVLLAVIATLAAAGLVVGLVLGLDGGRSQSASSPQRITIQQQNNPAPATPPTPPTVVTVPVTPPPPPPTCSDDPNNPLPACTVSAPSVDPFSVAVVYTSDVTSGDYIDAWNLLSASVQNQGWGGSYDTFVANFTPLGFDNVTEVSESGDAVTFTYDMNNINTGTLTPQTCTYTVDNGLITSST